MIVFHGTSGDRALVEKICDEGLRPADHSWAHETTGIAAHVFVCTTPIGSRGGDPIYFAQRLAGGDRSAWLFVADIDRTLVRGAVPNVELEQYWQARTFASVAFEAGAAASTQRLIERKRERRCAARELLEYRVASTAKDLCEGPPDAHTLVQFERAYMRVNRAEEKQRVAASYGLRLPTWWVEDSHYAWCAGCMHNLFIVDLVAGEDLVFQRGSFGKLDLVEFSTHVDALDRWLAAHGDPRLTTFADLQRRYPPPRDAVPRTLWPDFVTRDLEARMREPDTQLLVDHIPPARIVGAIELGSRSRLSNLVRPRHGEVLIDKINYLARQLVDQREHATKPIIVRD